MFVRELLDFLFKKHTPLTQAVDASLEQTKKAITRQQEVISASKAVKEEETQQVNELRNIASEIIKRLNEKKQN